MEEHKVGAFDGFSKKYHVSFLVWYEHHHSMQDAIQCEKQLKKWNRAWKIRLIEQFNRDWCDLHNQIDYLGTLVEVKAQACYWRKVVLVLR